MPRGLARLALALLLAGLLWRSLAASAARSIGSGAPGEASPLINAPAAPAPEQALGSGDLALYERIRARVAAGEPYYAAAMDEQRARDYPTRPFVAVRLPTLAVAGATLGLPAMRVLAGGLLAAAMAALQRRLAERTTRAERIAAQGMLVFGGAAAFVLPQVGWAGLGGRLGLLASLWFAGFLIAVALLARPDTFYWTQLVLPAYAVGLALAPRAIADLGKAALAPAASEA